MTGDPVAWIMIEPGWDVVGRGDERLGAVQETVGDPNIDIFDGLLVTTGVGGRPRYAPAEHVTAIYVGRVELDLDGDSLAGLAEEAPGSLKEIVGE